MLTHNQRKPQPSTQNRFLTRGSNAQRSVQECFEPQTSPVQQKQAEHNRKTVRAQKKCPTSIQKPTNNQGQGTIPVGGALKHNLQAWERITQNPWILESTQGYHLEFQDQPPPDNTHLPHPLPLTEEQTTVLDKEISDLIQKDAIEETSQEEGFFRPMFVPKKDGGWRPIINLKRLNTFLSVPHFKMEGIGNVKDIIQLGDFMGKIDLKMLI